MKPLQRKFWHECFEALGGGGHGTRGADHLTALAEEAGAFREPVPVRPACKPCRCLRVGRISDADLPYPRSIAPYGLDGWLADRDCRICGGTGWPRISNQAMLDAGKRAMEYMHARYGPVHQGFHPETGEPLADAWHEKLGLLIDFQTFSPEEDGTP